MNREDLSFNDIATSKNNFLSAEDSTIFQLELSFIRIRLNQYTQIPCIEAW